MSRRKPSVARVTQLAFLGLALLAASRANAEISTTRGASVVVFPKVIVDATRDTRIQISNTSNSAVQARCFYSNAAATSPEGAPLWQVTDFTLFLTRQQPTQWVVSAGRAVDLTDPLCSTGNLACSDAGFDPGTIPPVVGPFAGDLLCYEVDASGGPLGGNHLIGHATLKDRLTADVTKYTAISVQGTDLAGTTNSLVLDGEVYDACPERWSFEHLAVGAQDPLAGSGSTVETAVTVVPCAHDFASFVPKTVGVQFVATNEFESQFSVSTSVLCWATLRLDAVSSLFTRAVLGSDFVRTRMDTMPGSGGFFVVAEETHEKAGLPPVTSVSAVNPSASGVNALPDVIDLPQLEQP